MRIPNLITGVTARLPSSQRAVLQRLADGWVMDRAGRDMQAAVLFFGRGKPARRVVAKTVSALLADGLIEPALDGVTDYQLTAAGRKALT
jgi:hypothetical protein